MTNSKWQANVVSNNHFDADGLVGIYSLLHPKEADELKDFPIDIAAAGDFNTSKIEKQHGLVSFWMHGKMAKLPRSKPVFLLKNIQLSRTFCTKNCCRDLPE